MMRFKREYFDRSETRIIDSKTSSSRQHKNITYLNISSPRVQIICTANYKTGAEVAHNHQTILIMMQALNAKVNKSHFYDFDCETVIIN